MRRLALVVVLSLLCCAARAGDGLAAASIYGAAVGADLWSTEYALARGARELNPFVPDGRGARIAAGAALAGAAVAFDQKVLKKPAHRWIFRGVFVAARAYVVVHNVRAARRGR